MKGSSGKSKNQPKKGPAIQFFWEKKGSKNRSRFNLLLLDYGEYLLEDLSAYYFPIPTSDLSKTFEVKDALKVQGRFKLCSRSLIFEPADVRFPIMKFPYKYITCALEEFRLKASEIEALSVDLSPTGFFTYTCSCYVSMKENDKIGPYKTVDFQSSGGSHRCVFALVHADLSQLLVKVEQLRHIHSLYLKHGSSVSNQLLKPFIETAQLWTLSFNTSQLVSFHEQLLFDAPIALRRIRPLTTHPGSMMMTESRVYFQPSQLNNIGGESIIHFEIRRISRVFKRRYLLRQTGLEVLLNDGCSYLFACDASHTRDYLFDTLVSQPALRKLGAIGNSSDRLKASDDVLEMTQRWQRRQVSNFEYLMYLNNEADRSVNDIAQYPVFPHIIADFTSRKLNLEDPSIFRDLSKPVGALNPERLQYFKERFLSMPPADAHTGSPPPFLYGTHYSTPGYVLHYLVRVAPEYMLCLQNGKFDAPDRMFHSIEGTWQSCLTNPADLKELIPEFFTGSGEFLVNFDDLNLGHRHTGERLNDVELPRWADSPRDFIRKNAKALESEYVSEHLHEWIDLIFGYKQQGEEAVKANNLYYHVTYEGAVNLDQIEDSRERDAMVLQIQEFGQTPKQLFFSPHPCRNATITITTTTTAEATSSSSVSHSTTASFTVSAGYIDSGGVEQQESPNAAIPRSRMRHSSGGANRAGLVSTSPKIEPQAQPQQQSGSILEDFDEGSVAIVHLDDDFKRQVALELQHDAVNETSTVTAPNGIGALQGSHHSTWPQEREQEQQRYQEGLGTDGAGIAIKDKHTHTVSPARMIVLPPAAPEETVETTGSTSAVGGLLDSVFSWSRSTAASFLNANTTPAGLKNNAPPAVRHAPSDSSIDRIHRTSGDREQVDSSKTGSSRNSASRVAASSVGTGAGAGASTSSSSWSPLRLRMGSTTTAPANQHQQRQQQQAADAELVARFRRPSSVLP